MLRKGLLVSLLIISLGIVGCSNNSNEESDAIEDKAIAINEKGQELYNNKCANCHGLNLEGIVGPTLVTTGSIYNEEELLDIILNGIEKTTMPGGLLEGEEAEALAQWLAEKK